MGCAGSALLRAGFLWLWQAGSSPWWLLWLPSVGSEAGGLSGFGTLSGSTTCGILQDQEWNPCPLHGEANPWTLDQQGSPTRLFSDCSSLVSASPPLITEACSRASIVARLRSQNRLGENGYSCRELFLQGPLTYLLTWAPGMRPAKDGPPRGHECCSSRNHCWTE